MARGPLAGASGPGKYSSRTDLPSQYYGEGVETAAIKAGAPLAKTADVRPTAQSAMQQAATSQPITPLFAPTTRVDEPITSGIGLGPGPGPEVLGANPAQVKISDSLARMLPFDTTGEIAIMYQEALSRGN